MIRFTWLTCVSLAVVACDGDKPSVTYHADVAPILADRCLGCHKEGGVAPFTLTSYADAKAKSGKMAYVTRNRIMPPFLPDNSGACNEYDTHRWLSDEEIDVFQKWDEAGAPQGKAGAPIEPRALPTLERIDATATMSESYTPREDLDDDYRCFVIDPELAEDMYMTGFEVRPGVPEVVHHVIAFALRTEEQDDEAAELDAADEGPGYTCFGDSGITRYDSFAEAPAIAMAWAPGTGATQMPAGSGIELDAGRKLVMQVHYHRHEHADDADPTPAVADQTSIDFELADNVDNPGLVMLMADYNLNIPAGVGEHVEHDTFDLGDLSPVPFTVKLHMVFPHMHKLGVSQRLTVLRDGEEVCVMDVPRWDFDWQGFYQFKTPFSVSTSDSLRIECVYDSSLRETSTHWGEGTNDEMCLVGLYVTGG